MTPHAVAAALAAAGGAGQTAMELARGELGTASIVAPILREFVHRGVAVKAGIRDGWRVFVHAEFEPVEVKWK